MTTRFMKAFLAGMQEYSSTYPRTYASYKEYRYYMRGRKFVSLLLDTLPRGNRYE